MYLGNSIIEELLFRRALGGSPSLDNDINFWYGLQVQKLQITRQAEVGKMERDSGTHTEWLEGLGSHRVDGSLDELSHIF